MSGSSDSEDGKSQQPSAKGGCVTCNKDGRGQRLLKRYCFINTFPNIQSLERFDTAAYQYPHQRIPQVLERSNLQKILKSFLVIL